ncbi:hypothetical protein [Prevotella multiformis]|uniref:Uncharacterized protein n=1 Tax=Prevotella multiformis DSM 16608 TaxID=888743 RepID=F0FAJ9_9BACT|nr:hypothetical protein [Prevotella multiformis]EGC18820.1 hypothetical protein HMPREF9141_2616 [Prevotella multiformis DSM 16608]
MRKWKVRLKETIYEEGYSQQPGILFPTAGNPVPDGWEQKSLTVGGVSLSFVLTFACTVLSCDFTHKLLEITHK